MNEISGERLIKRVRLDGDPIEIYDGRNLERLRPHLAAISRCSDPRETHVLYFIDRDGEILEFLQFETLQIAIDQAFEIASIEDDRWEECDIEVNQENLASAFS